MDTKTDHIFSRMHLSHPDNNLLFSREIERWKKYYACQNPEALEQYLPDEKDSLDRFKAVYGLPPCQGNGIYSSIKRTCALTTDQFIWNLFSHETVDAIAGVFKDLKNADHSRLIPCLKELVENVAAHRKKIATVLQHDLYSGIFNAGELRSQDRNRELRERVSRHGYLSAWTHIAEKIYEEVNQNIHKFKPNTEEKTNEYTDDWNFKIEIHSGAFNEQIFFLHPPMTSALENRIYDRMADCVLNAEDFDKSFGKMAYVLCRHPLTKRGGSAITDWLVRGFALSAGYSPGKRTDEPMSYDWMAFVSFDEQTFVNWFSTEAYEKPGNTPKCPETLKTPIISVQNSERFFPKIQERKLSPFELIDQLKKLAPSIDKINWIKTLDLDANIVTEAFIDAAETGDLEILQCLSQFPLTEPGAFDNCALHWAASNGHLDVVKFLSTLPGVEDPASKENSALLWAKKEGHSEVVNYLASCSCYDPFEPNITFEKQQKRLQLLAEAGLETYIDAHRLEMEKRNSLYHPEGSEGSPCSGRY